jgi:hypothetical protein
METNALSEVVAACDGGTQKAASPSHPSSSSSQFIVSDCISRFYLRNITSLLLVDIHVECHPASRGRQGRRPVRCNIGWDAFLRAAFQYIIEERERAAGWVSLSLSWISCIHKIPIWRLFVCAPPPLLPIARFYHSTRPSPLWSHSCIITAIMMAHKYPIRVAHSAAPTACEESAHSNRWGMRSQSCPGKCVYSIWLVSNSVQKWILLDFLSGGVLFNQDFSSLD